MPNSRTARANDRSQLVSLKFMMPRSASGPSEQLLRLGGADATAYLDYSGLRCSKLDTRATNAFAAVVGVGQSSSSGFSQNRAVAGATNIRWAPRLPAGRPADHQHNWKATRGLAMGDEAVVRVACFSSVLAVAAEIAAEARQRELAAVRPLFGEGAVADRFSALVFNGEMNRSIAPEH